MTAEWHVVPGMPPGVVAYAPGPPPPVPPPLPPPCCASCGLEDHMPVPALPGALCEYCGELARLRLGRPACTSPTVAWEREGRGVRVARAVLLTVALTLIAAGMLLVVLAAFIAAGATPPP